MSNPSKQQSSLPEPVAMRSLLVSFAILVTLLAGDGIAGNVSTASADQTRVDAGPAIDVTAPSFSDGGNAVHSGGQAARIELDDADLNAGLSAWYRLAYLDGGTRLQVFEHYAATIVNPDSDIVQSENTAWRLANKAVGSDRSSAASDGPPRWARIRTGNNTGSSAGLMFTLAYIDLLTPGTLVGNLRVAGTGGIGPDGVVFPVSNVEVKVAAAVLTHPDVVFSPRPSQLIERTTIVESEHTRNPAAGYTVGEWLNLAGYNHAGRAAASHPGTAAFVVVHDVRQALAWLCGRTANPTTCAVADRFAEIPIGAPTLG